jgi:hypothetical protein
LLMAMLSTKLSTNGRILRKSQTIHIIQNQQYSFLLSLIFL